MGKLTKNQKLALSKIDPGKAYTLNEAAEKVKEASFEKFDASLDIDIRLGVDPRKTRQNRAPETGESRTSKENHKSTCRKAAD